MVVIELCCHNFNQSAVWGGLLLLFSYLCLQVMATLSDSGHRCGGSGEVFTTSDAQHPMVQRLLVRVES